MSKHHQQDHREKENKFSANETNEKWNKKRSYVENATFVKAVYENLLGFKFHFWSFYLQILFLFSNIKINSIYEI